jgi:hypothetical protein
MHGPAALGNLSRQLYDMAKRPKLNIQMPKGQCGMRSKARRASPACSTGPGEICILPWALGIENMKFCLMHIGAMQPLVYVRNRLILCVFITLAVIEHA